jgi:hypothetical protein
MSGTVQAIGIERTGAPMDAAELAAIVAVWAVVRVARWQAFLDDCRRDGVEVYVPLRPVRARRHAGRTTVVVEDDEPMYPGYGFVPADEIGGAVERARGWGGRAGEAGAWWTVSGAEIARIRAAEGETARRPWVDRADGGAGPAVVFAPGDRVRVEAGWLLGVEATVVAARRRGCVSIETAGGRLVHVPGHCLIAMD